MLCPACGFDNDPGHKFCAECGTRLATACPSCGAEARPGHKFCPECGTPLGSPASPAPGPSSAPAPATAERRLVTSLFCDLVGFTTFSESRDPEDVRDMLTRYFDLARAIVDRFGGVIDKFIGDAITVFWGATVAQPDDAERAVRAALELVDAVASLGEEIGVPDLRLRAGVLTGETAVGPGGNETGLVLGDVVNTAARLQSIAAPGTVAVGDATKALTESAITYEEVGVRELKGKEAPVRVWRAVRVTGTRGGRERADGLEPPFVGRDPELRLLKDMLHVTTTERRARLVSIVGEAGIGKSRLAWEFEKYIDGIVDAIYWHQGRSPAYSEGVTFWSLAEMVRRRAGISETDDPQRARTRLRTAVAEYIRTPDEQRWVEPRLAGLLGLEEMPSGDRTELYAALRTFFHRIAERGTAVLVFEDLHWADAGLLEFIEELIDRSPRHPLLVVTLARPEVLEKAEDWGRHRNDTSVQLGPIADTAMRALIAGTVPGLDERVLSEIVDRAAGIPLYAVEMIRTLINDGTIVDAGDGTYRLEGDATRIAVPDSLQAVIGARIDRLPAELRSLVKNAAVLGQSFTVEGLTVVSGRGRETLGPMLDGLVRSEILRLEDDPLSPERGQYQFLQSLIREVAYGRLTLGERKQHHLAVADYFGKLPDADMAAIVASHLIDAYRVDPGAADAAGLSRRAIESLLSAARRAAGLYSYRQVLGLTDQARTISDDPTVLGELELLRAEAAAGLVDYAQAQTAALQAVAHFETSVDEAGLVRSTTLLGRLLADVKRPLDAIEVMRPVFEAHDPPTTVDELALAASISRAYMISNQPEPSIAIADRALPSAESLEHMPTLVDLLITKGTSYMNVGRFQESLAVLRGAIQLAEGHDLHLSALRAYNNIGVLLEAEDSKANEENTRGGWEKARALGDPLWSSQFGSQWAYVLITRGELTEARAVEAMLDPATMAPEARSFFGYMVGLVELLTRDVTAGLETARAALIPPDGLQDPQTIAIYESQHAELCLLAGDYTCAYERAMGLEHAYGYPDQLELALVAAIWLEDAERVEEVQRKLSELDERGRMVRLLEGHVRLAAAASAGRDDEATRLARHVLDETALIRDDLRHAITAVTMARLLGLEHPIGAEAAETARSLLTDRGWVNLLEVFAAGLPVAEDVAAASAG
jgi:class 3 adenylate cyclase/tetratricopeptide (TPR) repeat protein